MIVSRLAITLAERFGVDIADAMSRARPDESCIDIIEPLTGYLSKDKILGCNLYRYEFEEGWALDVLSTGFYYRETSLTAADIILSGKSLPATVMLACSDRSIPITRIIEPATFDPFFLRSDVLVQSITGLFSIDWKAGRRVPALKFAVTF